MSTSGSIPPAQLQQVQQQPQAPSQPLNTNTDRISPSSSAMSFPPNLNDTTRKTSLQSSPISLASNLNNLSLGGTTSASGTNLPQQEHQQESIQPQQISQPISQLYTLKIKNLPADISLRESYCIFALAKDFLGVDLIMDSSNMPVLFAKFKSLSAASNYSQILESNQVFGPTYPSFLKTEVIVDDNHQIGLNIGSSAKRPSIGNQRSRFLFSDPFNNEAIPEAVPESSTAPTSATTNPNSNGLGKSLLLLESQQDAREYEQLVKDPWYHQQSQSSTLPTSASSIGGPPGITQPPTSSQFPNSNPQTPSIDWERRRQNSAFFNSQSPLLTSQLSSSQIPTQMSLNQPQQPQNPQPQHIPQGLVQPSMPIPPSSAPTPQSQQLPPQGPPGQPPSSASQPQTLNNSQQSSQVDLSLLARVPPPANPADQNPPCNTLYVGNLPPDATEAELRQLFSPQRGFRRLSFRTKTQQLNGTSQTNPTSSHSHGPMCFVEFEDVAHATRALAELYGRTLPRPGGIPGKGGIRLSFSKNPLGVRGPGQRRSSSFAYQGFKG